MENYTILNLNDDTISIYKNCFDANQSPKNPDNIRWQFFQNPNGNAFVDIAYDEKAQKGAAIYAVSCVPFKIGNEKTTGTQSLDTITDIDYRGKGLFIKLAKDVYQKAADGGMALVYGFPNGNSIHGFEKKLAWTVLDPVPFLIKPLKSKYFTDKIKFLKFLPNINLYLSGSKVIKEYTFTEQKQFPNEATAIWEKFSRNINVAVDRNKNYLDWRFVQKPNEDYKIVHCYNSNREYCGFVVYVVKEKHNGKIAYIMEMIYDLDMPETGKHLLEYAIDKIKSTGADCILSWCFAHSPNYGLFNSSFFLNMPEKFRPIELHFGACAYRSDLAEIINKRENWYISYADSDTV